MHALSPRQSSLPSRQQFPCGHKHVVRPACRHRANVTIARSTADVSTAVWERIQAVFNRKESPDVAERRRLRSVSTELLQLLVAPEAPELPRVNELLDELIKAEGQPFSESSLGGGPWVVRYTRGQPLLWNLSYSAGRLVNSANRASQEFDPADRSATNLVELNGPDSFIAAYGTYEPVDDAAVTPKTIRARIRSGRIVAWRLGLPLPIAGTGLFDVLYVDDGLRVFRSSNRVAVQVRADRLPAS